MPCPRPGAHVLRRNLTTPPAPTPGSLRHCLRREALLEDADKRPKKAQAKLPFTAHDISLRAMPGVPSVSRQERAFRHPRLNNRSRLGPFPLSPSVV